MFRVSRLFCRPRLPQGSNLIIHPGSPKTGTSTLQYIIRNNKRLLNKKGIGVILPADIRNTPFLAKYMNAYRKKNMSGIEQITADFFGPFLEKYDRLICSEETFFHDFMPSRKFAQGGIDGAEIAAEILSYTGADEIKFIITIRPQWDLLISTYTHFVHRHKETRDFGSWITTEVDPNRVLWQPVRDAFVEKFGPGSTEFISMAEFSDAGIDCYFNRVLNAFEIDRFKLKFDLDLVHNPSPSRRAVQLCRNMNREDIDLRQSTRLNSEIVQRYPVSTYGKFEPQNWSLSEELRASYAADHSAVLT